MQTADLLDLVKANKSFTSDYQLAKAMQVPTQTISQWRSGASFPSLVRLYQLCAGAGLEPGLVLAQLELEREEKAGRENVANAWRTWLKEVGGVAAAVLLGTVLIGPDSAQSRASAQSPGDGLYIMSTRRRVKMRRSASWTDPLRALAHAALQGLAVKPAAA